MMIASSMARALQAMGAPAAVIGPLFLVALVTGIGGAAVFILRFHAGLHWALMKAIGAPLGLTFHPGPNPSASRFAALGLAPTAGVREVKGTFRGERNGVKFEIVEVIDSQGLGKETRFTTAHVLMTEVDTNADFPCTVVMLRDGAGHPAGLEPVGLVDARLERRFSFFSNDQIESRVLLNPAYMEELAQLDQRTGGHLVAAFIDGSILSAVKTVNFPTGKDAWPSVARGLMDREKVEPFARDLVAAMNAAQGLRPPPAWTR